MFITVQLFLAITMRTPPRTSKDTYSTTLAVQVEDCDRQFVEQNPEMYKVGKRLVYVKVAGIVKTYFELKVFENEVLRKGICM
jgi:hypothetical protein